MPARRLLQLYPIISLRSWSRDWNVINAKKSYNLQWWSSKWVQVSSILELFQEEDSPKELAEFVCNCFALLHFVEHDILSDDCAVTESAMYILKLYSRHSEFCCEFHEDWGMKVASKIIVNIYFNNKQKKSKDITRKDAIKGFKLRQLRE